MGISPDNKNVNMSETTEKESLSNKDWEQKMFDKLFEKIDGLT